MMLQSNPRELEQRLYPIELSKPKTTFGGLNEQISVPKVIPNPIINCNMPPYQGGCILRANKDGSISDDFTKTRAYEVGYRINPMTAALNVMSYSKFGNEIFEFGNSAFTAPEGAVRSTAQEYRNFIDNPDPSNDFYDGVLPQTLRDPLIKLPSFNPVNDSAINPQPFINLDPEKKTSNLPIIIGLLLLGFFIIK